MTDAMNRDQEILDTATDFHDQAAGTPDLLMVLKADRSALLTEYLHRLPTAELEALAAEGSNAARLARGIVEQRRLTVQESMERDEQMIRDLGEIFEALGDRTPSDRSEGGEGS